MAQDELHELEELGMKDDGENHTVTLTVSGLSVPGALQRSHYLFVLAEACGSRQAHGQGDGQRDLVVIENGRTIEGKLVQAVERIAALLNKPVAN